jgi:uncharacterized membrane protein
MTTPSIWALSLIYWLHMLATVAWIGSLVTLSILVLPSAREALDAKTYVDWINHLRRRLDPLAWISLILLVATGLFQMSANPNYQGFLAFNNRWAVAMLIKHLIFLLLIGSSAYLTWGVIPKLQRAALLAARGGDSLKAEHWQKREASLLRLNIVLGILVLAFTAIARAS